MKCRIKSKLKKAVKIIPGVIAIVSMSAVFYTAALLHAHRIGTVHYNDAL